MPKHISAFAVFRQAGKKKEALIFSTFTKALADEYVINARSMYRQSRLEKGRKKMPKVKFRLQEHYIFQEMANGMDASPSSYKKKK